MKSSPCWNVTPNVRPAFNSLAFISGLRSFAVFACVQLRYIRCLRESLPDPGIAYAGGDQQMQQDAGLQRVQVARADEAPGQQVPFGSRKAVGESVDWARACPGGQHDRDALGKLAEHGRDGGRDVSGTERRYDQAISMLGYCFDHCAVVAQGDGCQAYSGASARYRAKGW